MHTWQSNPIYLSNQIWKTVSAFLFASDKVGFGGNKTGISDSIDDMAFQRRGNVLQMITSILCCTAKDIKDMFQIRCEWIEHADAFVEHLQIWFAENYFNVFFAV